MIDSLYMLILNTLSCWDIAFFYIYLNYKLYFRVECLIVPHLDHEPESLQEIKKQIKGVDAVIWNVKHKFTKEILDIAGKFLLDLNSNRVEIFFTSKVTLLEPIHPLFHSHK